MKAKNRDIRFISVKDADFPRELSEKECPWPPKKGIYLKGKLSEGRRVAIVGTRRATSYGKDSARKIGEILAKEGLIIVSGLALGIDSAAHEGALAAGGITWAVLGSGIDNIYPRTNKELSEKIFRGKGAIISEYEPEAEASKWTFPERNRIVAALSELIIVIDAPEKSGALITARLGLEAGKEVAVIPGDISRPNFQGSNRLLREGAHMIAEPKDALYLLGIVPNEKKQKFDNLDKMEEAILQCLSGPKNSDEIIAETKLAAEIISRKLTELELKNAVRRSAGIWQRL